MAIKRSREDAEIETLAMANCLMLLSKIGEASPLSGRVFSCKTCDKKFSSFQALGGHRASHKKPKLTAGEVLDQSSSPPKPKTHECPICGLEFGLGQALGGHMRRHRAAAALSAAPVSHKSSTPFLKRVNSKRIFGLDLNLTPLENDLKLGISLPPAWIA